MNTAVARIAAGVAASIMVGLGCWWLLAPDQIPFTGLARLRIGHLLPDRLIGLPLLLGGLAGVALVALLPRIPAAAGRLSAAALGVGVFDAYQGNGTLSVLGYALAVAVPPLLVAGLVVGLVRVPRLRLPLVLLVTGGLGLGAVAGFGDPAGWQGLLAFAPRVFGNLLVLAVPLILAVCGGWFWLAVALDPAPFDRVLRWTTRHRRPITIAAAACFLPYAVIRLLWLAGIALDGPLFGVGGPGAPTELDLGTRLWGASLGVASILGALAVLGLICRWGEVFPRRLPVLGGRPVPVPLAVVPGTLAGIAFLAMLPKAVSGIVEEFPRSLVTALVMPFPVWGPLLILAVAGYLGHRRGPAGR